MAWSILALSLATTALAWYVSDSFVRQRAQEIFRFQVEEARVAISKRMQEYEQVLRGGAGFFNASPAVSRAEWRSYYETMQLERHYPGIQGYGFSLWIAPEDKAKVVEQVRREGFPTFDLKPPGERTEYTSILYLEPLADRNLRALGFDMWTEAVLREAMARARDSGQPALSGLVTLVHETAQAVQAGVMMYFPVYRAGAATAAIEQRRAALQGFVYSSFRMYDLMRGILGQREPEIAVEVYDGSTPSVATLLVDSDREFAPLPRDYVPTFTATNTMKIAGRTWTLNFHSRPRFDLATESNQPLLIASGGVLVDALLFVIIWQLWVHRTRSATVAQRAVAELRGSEERSRQVVESAPNAMVMVDRDGCIVLVNAQTERMFGYRRTELIGQPMEMLVPARYRVPHPDLRAGFFAAPQSRPMGAGRDLYALRKDGSEFPVEIGLNPIDTTEGARVLAAVIDITERKAAQQRVEDALQEKTVLLNEIHHRVKNNLQIISSLLNLQSGKTDRADIREALAESQGRVRAMALIHQLMYEGKDLSRVDLGEYLQGLVRLAQESYGADRRRVSIRLEAAKVFLDLQRAVPCGLLVNELISNAFKHAFPDGRVGEIKVCLKPIGGEMVLSVRDNGVGLPQGLNVSATRSLGLQLVKLLADQVGARLTVGSAPGTCFELRFDAIEEALA